MTTATTTEIFYCTEFTSWPAPEIGNDRYKGKPTPVCWQEFPTFEARAAHYREAHAEILNASSEHHRRFMLERGADAWMPPAEPIEMASVQVAHDPEPTPGGRPSSKPVDSSPSPEQLDLIERLGKQKQQETREVKTKAAASIEIERLMAFPDKGLKPNRYPGECTECRCEVEAEAGFIRKVGDKWFTAHKPGDCPAPVAPLAEIPDGFYAISAEAGHTSFYKVTKGRVPGVVFVDLLIGGGPNGSFQRQAVPRGNRKAILDKIAVDAEAAGQRFFDEASRCRRCMRGLTKEESRKNGYGKDCAEMIGI